MRRPTVRFNLIRSCVLDQLMNSLLLASLIAVHSLGIFGISSLLSKSNAFAAPKRAAFGGGSSASSSSSSDSTAKKKKKKADPAPEASAATPALPTDSSPGAKTSAKAAPVPAASPTPKPTAVTAPATLKDIPSAKKSDDNNSAVKANAGGVTQIKEIPEKVGVLRELDQLPSPSIQWDTKTPTIRTYWDGKKKVVLAEIQITVKKDSSWKMQQGTFQITESQNASGTSTKFFLTMFSSPTPFQVEFKSKKGTIKRQRLEVSLGDWVNYNAIPYVPKVDEPVLFQPGHWDVFADFDLRKIQYIEDGIATFNSWDFHPGLTVRTYLSHPEWVVEVKGGATALAFGLSPSNIEKARFLNLQGRLGYRFNIDDGHVLLDVNVGLYYETMINSTKYGFRNLILPELFPSVQWNFDTNQWLGLHIKYMPAADNMSFTAREKKYSVAVNYGFGLGTHWLTESYINYEQTRVNLSGEAMINYTALGLGQSLRYSF